VQQGADLARARNNNCRALGRGERAHGDALSRCHSRTKSDTSQTHRELASTPRRELPPTTACCLDHDRGRCLTSQTKALGAQSGDRMKIENPARSSAPVAGAGPFTPASGAPQGQSPPTLPG
jgi:hypothetical protein